MEPSQPGYWRNVIAAFAFVAFAFGCLETAIQTHVEPPALRLAAQIVLAGVFLGTLDAIRRDRVDVALIIAAIELIITVFLVMG